MSNSLTVGLAILGGLVLAGVVAQGAWSARKNTIRTPKRSEPNDPLSQAAAQSAALEGAMGPSGQGLGEGAAFGAVASSAAKRGPQRLDALIDAIAVISLDQPLTGDQVMAHQPTTRRAGSKPFMIEGLRADCGEWEAVQPGVTYSELQAGVLLANRLGGLNEIEYSEFVQKIQGFADSLSAGVEFPDMLDVVARAKELDAFASAHDAQLAMRLFAKGSAWSVGYVQQQAARHGFVPGVLPGRLVIPAAEEGAPPILTLHFDAQAAFAEDPEAAALRDLQLAFDVPQTAAELEPFKAWCAAGEALSLSLDAVMVDDQGQAFSPAAFTAIEGELQRLYEALAQRDLAAGSLAARRLFS
jgi:hypothetical protein